MSSSSGGVVRRGTRWGRTGVLTLVGYALIAAMAGATLNSVLGFEASVRIINSNGLTDQNGMSFSSSRIQAVDAGFGIAPVQQAGGAWKNVLRAGFSNATISGLCIAKIENLGPLGAYTLMLTSPSSAGNITASNGVFDLTDLVGDSSSIGVNLKGSTQIGLGTPDITTVYANGTGLPYLANPFGQSTGDSPLDIWNPSIESGTVPPAAVLDGKSHLYGGGWTGIDAGAADLYKVAGRLWQVQLTGNITLPNLQLTITQGTNKCSDWPSVPPYTNTTKYDGTHLFP